MQCLNDLKVGKSCIIEKILTKGAMRRRFLDIGLTENTKVSCAGASPMGDPRAYLIRGAVIAIRSEDCADIFIREE